MRLHELMNDFFGDEIDVVPSFLKSSVAQPDEICVEPHEEWWKEVESPHRLLKDFYFTDRKSMQYFLNELIQFENSFGHHGKITIEDKKVRVEVWTHDVESVTELDTEYAQYVDKLREDINYYGQ